MEKAVKISDNEKWKAVVACEKSYDGMFFYGVKTTGIFCRPSCRAKTPARENVVFFDDGIKAIEAGFRPCKRCCPDKAIFEPDLELVKKAKDIIDLDFDNPIEIGHVARQLGISPNHLARLFKKQFGSTPSRYITGVRVGKAEKLLRQADASILEIAYMTGFKSLSNFYKCFKELTGNTPKEHRESKGGL
ncbi:MAG TPA: Ada metal-binding domain-containing protein [Patescibacteria group bacterium]|nr:Ada metal-binding domain-containing protein [Patescibacteria group bacterium]